MGCDSDCNHNWSCHRCGSTCSCWCYCRDECNWSNETQRWIPYKWSYLMEEIRQFYKNKS